MNRVEQLDQCRQAVQQLHDRARVVVSGIEKENDDAMASLSDLDSELRQFFDILSAQDPVTPAELTILEDVGALLNRAKTLAEEQRKLVLGELKHLNNSRSGIQAYRSADANH